MNGVMIPSVSAGSSQRDASVMWTPHVIVPSGAAAAGATLVTTRRSARRYLMIHPPFEGPHYSRGGNFFVSGYHLVLLRVDRERPEAQGRRSDGPNALRLGVGGSRARVRRPARCHR